MELDIAMVAVLMLGAVCVTALIIMGRQKPQRDGLFVERMVHSHLQAYDRGRSSGFETREQMSYTTSAADPVSPEPLEEMPDYVDSDELRDDEAEVMNRHGS